MDIYYISHNVFILFLDDKEEVISVGKLSHLLTFSKQLLPVLESRIISQLLSLPSRQQSTIQIMSQITALSRQLFSVLESRIVSPRQLSQTLELRTNAQNNFH
ncbi:hypothetical protein F8M41_012838 [Gigaspora margarita]|uniref:Uncharacterized protein n=1 Tax=Gigaspora margarita TaxID=4874 RepID=A0A8H3WXH5_GIGMA|nr:hypothetical protein F8M41_012838 [Gigaspora margarita]